MKHSWGIVTHQLRPMDPVRVRHTLHQLRLIARVQVRHIPHQLRPVRAPHMDTRPRPQLPNKLYQPRKLRNGLNGFGKLIKTDTTATTTLMAHTSTTHRNNHPIKGDEGEEVAEVAAAAKG